ncbi:hypothetical protein TorRG33x02_155150 [Trema orientale]|uniref:Uncharacterized protein n=1 Tax=Trema orientale TaxID=63057 RepID=A0A2P5ETC8_TREOI|nr:hypothetical protein TorRG33x02_155150 [Trema orientale]
MDDQRWLWRVKHLAEVLPLCSLIKLHTASPTKQAATGCLFGGVFLTREKERKGKEGKRERKERERGKEGKKEEKGLLGSGLDSGWLRQSASLVENSKKIEPDQRRRRAPAYRKD